MVRNRRIRRGKMREHQYREGYARSLEGKGVEWDGDDNVKHIWDQVKWEILWNLIIIYFIFFLGVWSTLTP